MLVLKLLGEPMEIQVLLVRVVLLTPINLTINMGRGEAAAAGMAGRPSRVLLTVGHLNTEQPTAAVLVMFILQKLPLTTPLVAF